MAVADIYRVEKATVWHNGATYYLRRICGAGDRWSLDRVRKDGASRAMNWRDTPHEPPAEVLAAIRRAVRDARDERRGVITG